MIAERLTTLGACAGLVILFGWALEGWSKKAPATPCPAGRFLVDPGNGQLVEGASTGAVDSVTLDGQGRISIGSGCLAVAGRITAKRHFTKLTAKWPSCGSASAARLKAKIVSPDCGVMTGRFKPKGGKLHPFTARRSTCGDGFVDGPSGEQCEPGVGGCSGGIGCTAACTCESPTTTLAPPTTTVTSSITTTIATTTTLETTTTTVSSSTTTTLETTTTTVTSSTATTTLTTTTTTETSSTTTTTSTTTLPTCGDGVCNGTEDACTCVEDCNTPGECDPCECGGRDIPTGCYCDPTNRDCAFFSCCANAYDVCLDPPTTTVTTVTTTSITTTTTGYTCGGLGRRCDGTCPDGQTCVSGAGFPSSCGCQPTCGASGPACNGVCPLGTECIPRFQGCDCIEPTTTTTLPCRVVNLIACGGWCPPGEYCGFDSSPGVDTCACLPITTTSITTTSVTTTTTTTTTTVTTTTHPPGCGTTFFDNGICEGWCPPGQFCFFDLTSISDICHCVDNPF